MHPASRKTGEGRADILRAWGPRLEQEGARGGRGGVRGQQKTDACYDRGSTFWHFFSEKDGALLLTKIVGNRQFILRDSCCVPNLSHGILHLHLSI